MVLTVFWGKVVLLLSLHQECDTSIEANVRHVLCPIYSGQEGTSLVFLYKSSGFNKG